VVQSYNLMGLFKFFRKTCSTFAFDLLCQHAQNIERLCSIFIENNDVDFIQLSHRYIKETQQFLDELMVPEGKRSFPCNLQYPLTKCCLTGDQERINIKYKVDSQAYIDAVQGQDIQNIKGEEKISDTIEEENEGEERLRNNSQT